MSNRTIEDIETDSAAVQNINSDWLNNTCLIGLITAYTNEKNALLSLTPQAGKFLIIIIIGSNYHLNLILNIRAPSL
jgi:hypothetical protein